MRMARHRAIARFAPSVLVILTISCGRRAFKNSWAHSKGSRGVCACLHFMSSPTITRYCPKCVLKLASAYSARGKKAKSERGRDSNGSTRQVRFQPLPL